MSDEENENRDKNRWKLIKGGKKKNDDEHEKENEILKALREFLSTAQDKTGMAPLAEFTFVVSVRSISTKETVIAETAEEAEKIISVRFPGARIELVKKS
jgi:hypothetical protein